MLDRMTYFQTIASNIKLGLTGQIEGVPIEQAEETYHQDIQFALLDLLHATSVGFELRVLQRSQFPSLKDDIENFWYFLEAQRFTLKALVDLHVRRPG